MSCIDSSCASRARADATDASVKTASTSGSAGSNASSAAFASLARISACSSAVVVTDAATRRFSVRLSRSKSAAFNAVAACASTAAQLVPTNICRIRVFRVFSLPTIGSSLSAWTVSAAAYDGHACSVSIPLENTEMASRRNRSSITDPIKDSNSAWPEKDPRTARPDGTFCSTVPAGTPSRTSNSTNSGTPST